jgi:nucleotide-binding universal stress UspA family protein
VEGKMIKDILVLTALDTEGASHAATGAGYAATVARAFDARITLLGWLEPSAVQGQGRFIDPVDWHITRSRASSQLGGIAAPLRKEGLEVSSDLLESSGIEQIIGYIEGNAADLLVVLEPPGSVSDRVHQLLMHIPIPVLIVRADGPAPSEPAEICFERIMVPLDGSQRAECVFPLAGQIAQACGATLILAHVIRPPEMPGRPPLASEDVELVDRVVARNRGQAEGYLAEIAARMPVETEQRLVVDDRVAATLHHLSEEAAADLVILSAHGYSGEPRWPYGSIANNLITYSTRPVLVVQDFATDAGRPIHEQVSPRTDGLH